MSTNSNFRIALSSLFLVFLASAASADDVESTLAASSFDAGPFAINVSKSASRRYFSDGKLLDVNGSFITKANNNRSSEAVPLPSGPARVAIDSCTWVRYSQLDNPSESYIPSIRMSLKFYAYHGRNTYLPAVGTVEIWKGSNTLTLQIGESVCLEGTLRLRTSDLERMLENAVDFLNREVEEHPTDPNDVPEFPLVSLPDESMLIVHAGTGYQPTDNPAFPLILSFDSDYFASTSGQTAYRGSPAGINFSFMVSGGLEKRVRFNRKSEKYEIVDLVPKE